MQSARRKFAGVRPYNAVERPLNHTAVKAPSHGTLVLTSVQIGWVKSYPTRSFFRQQQDTGVMAGVRLFRDSHNRCVSGLGH